MDKIDGLIQVLLDNNARIDERDDAAMYLRKYDDDRALNALMSVVLNPIEEPFIMDVCGGAIAEMWVKRNYFDPNLYKKMNPDARHELYGYISGMKPEWIQRYKLNP